MAEHTPSPPGRARAPEQRPGAKTAPGGAHEVLGPGGRGTWRGCAPRGAAGEASWGWGACYAKGGLTVEAIVRRQDGRDCAAGGSQAPSTVEEEEKERGEDRGERSKKHKLCVDFAPVRVSHQDWKAPGIQNIPT